MKDLTKCCGRCGNDINQNDYKKDEMFQAFYNSMDEITKDEIHLLQEEMCCSCFLNTTPFFENMDVYEDTNEDLEYVLMEDDILEEGFRLFNRILIGTLDDKEEVVQKLVDLLFQSYGDYGYYYVFNVKKIDAFLELSLYCKPENPILICTEKKHIYKLKARLRTFKAKYGLEMESKIINNRMELHIIAPIKTILCMADFHHTINLDNLTFEAEYYTPEEKEIILSNIMLQKLDMVDEQSLKILAGKA